MLDALRVVKSPREIARDPRGDADRRPWHHRGDARREARIREYELQADAEFVFKKHGALRRVVLRAGRDWRQHVYSHYHAGTAVLRDGDLVQFDYAPDYKYYQSDVTRVFPANGGSRRGSASCTRSICGSIGR